MATNLSIIPVESRRSRRLFIHLPWSVYRKDSAWVPPLLLERFQHISQHNPYFEHAEWKAWIAMRDNKPVGRISAQIDQLYLKRYCNQTGFFGMLEAENDIEIFRLLMNTAEAWLRSKGMMTVLGPFNFSINDECGLLVDGFDTPPSIMMGHALPYYGPIIEELDYTPTQDLLAYRIPPDFAMPDAMRALTAKASDSVRLRSLNRSRRNEDFSIIRDIFNDAWSQNWGFVPFTETEFARIGRDLSQIVDDDFIQIAEVSGQPAGMIVMLPNINEAIRDLNGRLLPIGWLKLLWRLKRNFPTTARIPLMGICHQYQQSLMGTALALLLINALRVPAARRGIKEVEMSWILSNNLKMRNLIEALGGVKHKVYRLYKKPLANT